MAELLFPRRSESQNYKRLIVLCDGTWQDSTNDDEDEYPSNVTRLGRAISQWHLDKDGREVEQIVLYLKGVGTGMSDRLFGGVLGMGVSANIRTAYSFLSNNYDRGDSIYIFGFSRGAYTARALAGLISDTGLLTKRGMDHFQQLYGIYYNFRQNLHRVQADAKAAVSSAQKAQLESGLEKARAYISSLPEGRVWPEAANAVRIVGVWDTVAFHHPEYLSSSRLLDSMGFRFSEERVEFADINVPERVQYAFHALSLDESRKAYLPTMWTLPRDRPTMIPLTGFTDPGRRPILKQVWFCGEHSDVGGGRTNPALSDISLGWMISQCYDTGLLGFDLSYLCKLPAAPAIQLEADGRPVQDTAGRFQPGPVQRAESDGPLLLGASSPQVVGLSATASTPLRASTFPTESAEDVIRQVAHDTVGKVNIMPSKDPWATSLGPTRSKETSTRDKMVSGVQRLAGTVVRQPRSITDPAVWTNEFIHESVLDRVLVAASTGGRAKDAKSVPGQVVYPLSSILPGPVKLGDDDKAGIPVSDDARPDIADLAIEVVNKLGRPGSADPDDNTDASTSRPSKLKDRLRKLVPSSRSPAPPEPKVAKVYLPLAPLGTAEKVLKNKIRLASEMMYIEVDKIGAV